MLLIFSAAADVYASDATPGLLYCRFAIRRRAAAAIAIYFTRHCRYAAAISPRVAAFEKSAALRVAAMRLPCPGACVLPLRLVIMMRARVAAAFHGCYAALCYMRALRDIRCQPRRCFRHTYAMMPAHIDDAADVCCFSLALRSVDAAALRHYCLIIFAAAAAFA